MKHDSLINFFTKQDGSFEHLAFGDENTSLFVELLSKTQFAAVKGLGGFNIISGFAVLPEQIIPMWAYTGSSLLI